MGEYQVQIPKVSLLQYVDDILIAATDWESLKGTKWMLHALGALSC